MRVKVDKKDLQEAVKKVVSEKKAALPILTNFLLKAENNKLIVYGTDLEIYTSYWIPAEVIEEGTICVNAKKLTDISKVLPQNEVDISLEGSKLKITSGKTKYNLAIIDPEDYPTFEPFPSDMSIIISGSELIKGINKTSYAASKIEERYALNGLCLSFTESGLDFVATDGHRLALYKTTYTGKGIEGKYIIPQKALGEIKKLILDIEDVEVAVSGSSIFFKGSNYEITVRLLEGVFPDYTQVIPKQFNIQLQLPQGEFIETIKRVITAEDSDTKPLKIKLMQNKLIASTPTSDDTYAEDEMDINYDGNDFEIGFNGKYIIEAVEKIDGENIFIKLIDKDSQAMFVPTNEEEKYLAIVMPMTI